MFNTLLIQPIYNVFIFLIGVMPGGDVGLAIVVLTLIIRAVFYPAFASSIKTQMGMQEVQGELDEINKQYKDVPEERARRTMELFKEHKVHPFSGFVALLVQIPVFIALYYAFFREDLPHIATNLLYSSVHVPQAISLTFLGLIDLMSKHNIILALLVGALQYSVVRLSVRRMKMGQKKTTAAGQKEAAQKMQQQMMLYFLPTLIAIISYSLPAAVAIYFITGNLVSLTQELVIRRQMKKA